TRVGHVVVERSGSEIYLRGKKTVKLSPFESVISILNQEEDIAPAYDSFKRIIRSQFTESEVYSPSEFPEFSKMAKSKPRLEDVQESGMDSRLKIALVYQCIPDTFAKIKARFIEVFPQVEDVRLEPEKQHGFPAFFEEYPLLQIKEKGVKDWIRQARISSGMYKTFMHISEMFLWPSGTVVLIDEFENSLGINCIDVLTEDLLEENRRLQFILTSHHPYIINNISPKYWKVVTRDGGVVSTHDASALRLDSSSHTAFIQLINLEQYREGITQK
ncbi:MAG: AAA family ATPase, partial [Pyrinomonadaceae bacterium]